jgi:hypothetical protein
VDLLQNELSEVWVKSGAVEVRARDCELSALEGGMLSGSTPRYVFVKRCSAVDPGPMPTTRCDI